jgi:CRISPR-associated protein Csm5
MDLRRYRLKIETYSPVHIGSSSDFEPTNYVIAKEQKTPVIDEIICPECGYKNRLKDVQRDACCLSCESKLDLPEEQDDANEHYLFTFTPFQLAQILSSVDKADLKQRAQSEKLDQLQSFFKKKASQIVSVATKRAHVSPEIAKDYEEKCGNITSNSNNFNQFQIEKTISSENEALPYLPGSSIKGAFRTCLMSAKNDEKYLQPEKDQNGRNKRSIDYERELYNFRSVTEDPFRHLKITDAFSQTSFLTEMVSAFNSSKKNFAEKLPKKIEIIPQHTVFSSEITITDEQKFTMEEVREVCNRFHLKQLREDNQNLSKIYGVPQSFFEGLCEAAKKGNTFIFRIGKHGGAENVTIDGLRNIKIMCGKGNPPLRLDHSTTYWMVKTAKGFRPFGWCVATFEEI